MTFFPMKIKKFAHDNRGFHLESALYICYDPCSYIFLTPATVRGLSALETRISSCGLLVDSLTVISINSKITSMVTNTITPIASTQSWIFFEMREKIILILTLLIVITILIEPELTLLGDGLWTM